MNKKLYILFFALIAFFSGKTQTYTAVYDSSSFLNEKLIVFTNKTLYLAGEEIVFSLYAYDAVYTNMVSMSLVAYAELISQDGDVIGQSKVQLTDGYGIGKVVASKDLETDYYYLRVYTRYMMNNGVENYAYKRIELINTFKFLTSNDFIEDSVFAYRYFLKDSMLSCDKENTIAIDCFNASANNLHRIAITDTTGTEVVFSDTRDSLLFLSFVPQLTKQYYLTFHLSDTIIKELLPKPVENVGELMFSEFSESFEVFKSIDGKCSLNILKDGILLYSNEIDRIPLIINKAEVPKGIICFALKCNGKLIDYKYYYNQYPSFLKSPVSIDSVITTRDSLQLEIGKNAGINSCFVVPQNNLELYDTINPLFANDLTALSIELSYTDIKRAYYDSTFRNAFFLGLEYKESNTNILYQPEIEGDIISGSLLLAGKNSPVSNKELVCIIPDSLYYFFDIVKTNIYGKFHVIINGNNTSTNLLFNTLDSLNDYTLKVDDEFDPAYLPVRKEQFKPDKKLADYLKTQMLVLQVKDAYYNSKKQEFDSKRTNFYGQPDNVVFFDKFIKLPVFEEYVKELMTGVYVAKKRKKKYIRISNFDGQGYTGTSPLLLVNGVYIREHEKILELDPQKVAYVRIFNRIVYYKNVRFDGVFEVITKDVIPINKLNNKNIFLESYMPAHSSFISLNVDVTSNIPVYESSQFASISKESKSVITIGDQEGIFDMKVYSLNSRMEISIFKKSIIIK